MECRITKKYWKRALHLAHMIMMSLAVTSCYYDNEEYLYPNAQPCDTTNVSFSENVWPVISESCAGCHGGNAPAGNIPLENYQEVVNAAQIPAGQYGSLIGVIKHAPGNSPMPQNGNKLSDCKISQIEAWIAGGMPDN